MTTPLPKSGKLADSILHFLSDLKTPENLPAKTGILNPYTDNNAWAWCTQFYQQYYADNQRRTLMLGINPGRFGAGITGIPFTDPVRLERVCGIPNNLPKKPELSSEFMYQMMSALGGLKTFNAKIYISSLSPLGFVRDGRNLNYYDDPALQKKITPFMVKCLKDQMAMGMNNKLCFCLGEDKNFKFLSTLNEKHGFFQQIIPLPHPRFIMQYRRRKIDEYIERYASGFALAKD